jgi:hypothetical protein
MFSRAARQVAPEFPINLRKIPKEYETNLLQVIQKLSKNPVILKAELLCFVLGMHRRPACLNPLRHEHAHN